MYKKILVPVSLDQPDNAAEALRVADSLRSGDGELFVINCSEPIPGASSHYLDAGTKKERTKDVEDTVSGLLAGYENFQTEHVVGRAGPAIVDFARQNDIDMIVVFAHQTGLMGYFIGSTAERVVRHAEVPVLVLR